MPRHLYNENRREKGGGEGGRGELRGKKRQVLKNIP